jgi:recombination protein RecA
MAPPFAKVEFDIMYGQGISREGDILDLGVKHDIVDKSGAWFSYNGERLGQGRDNSKNFLKENPEMMEEIRQKVCEAKGIDFGANKKTAKAAEETEEKKEAKAETKSDSKSTKSSKKSKKASPRAH